MDPRLQGALVGSGFVAMVAGGILCPVLVVVYRRLRKKHSASRKMDWTPIHAELTGVPNLSEYQENLDFEAGLAKFGAWIGGALAVIGGGLWLFLG